MVWLEGIEMTESSGKEALNIIVTTVKNLRVTLLRTTKLIHNLAKTEPYRDSVALLRSIPGIGIITAMTLLTELENVDRFSNTDQLCRFIGFVPSTHSSGEKDKTGNITKRGHSILRSTLIESAWIAARLDPALSKSYNEYCKRMESNEAIIRIAKKLVNRISYVLKNKKPYEYRIVK